jgi:2TM domain
MENDDAYRRARHRVAALRGFYIHLTVFLLVNALLFVINIVTSPGTWWFYWVLFGWGIGLLAHAAAVFGFGNGGWLGRDWEERKVREYMERDSKG